MIQIDPDDTELRHAINLVESKKALYEKADKAWNRSETSMFEYTQQYDKYVKARESYNSALINLALIFMERL